MNAGKCRSCSEPLNEVFANLGFSPPSNSNLNAEQLFGMEKTFPLCAYVCKKCLLVQLDAFESPDDIFSDYDYFSSYSSSWLAHCKATSEMLYKKLQLSDKSSVIEIASNDGYMLKNFKEFGTKILGIEPAKNVADVAIEQGIPSIKEFFGRDIASQLAAESTQADLLIANNVYAHVPDIHDFTAGMKTILATTGTISIEFPHLLQLMEFNQFDTIYHEHFSYFSLKAVNTVLSTHQLEVYDLQEIPTHGGSLRLLIKHVEDKTKSVQDSVAEVLKKEQEAGLHDIATYQKFQDQVKKIKRDFLSFLIEAEESHKTVAGYGAAAKGNTLLNYCGVKSDEISFIVDRNPRKQNKFAPGSHIAIVDEEQLKLQKPDYIVIFPWNLRDEIVQQLSYAREWGAKFVVPVPKIEVF